MRKKRTKQIFINGSKLKAILWIVVLLFIVFPTKAQQNDTLKFLQEKKWIEKKNDKISFVFSQNNDYETFKINSTKQFQIYPNTPTIFQFSLNYQFLSFGFHFSPQFIATNKDLEAKGKTKSFGIKTSFQFKNWINSFSISKIRGYYLYNTSDFTSWNKGDAYIQFPNLTYMGGSFNTMYIFNPRFSMNSITSFTERQLKSAGSFSPSLNLSYYIIDDKSEKPGTQKTKNFEICIGPSYIHTFVVNQKFYLSLGLFSGLGYLNTEIASRLTEGNINANQNNLVFRGEGKLGIGYNGEKFYAGLYANLIKTKYKQENTTVTDVNTKIMYNFYIGYRIDVPKIIKNQINKLPYKLVLP